MLVYLQQNSFVLGTNMVAMSIVFCVNRDCVKTLYSSVPLELNSVLLFFNESLLLRQKIVLDQRISLKYPHYFRKINILYPLYVNTFLIISFRIPFQFIIVFLYKLCELQMERKMHALESSK